MLIKFFLVIADLFVKTFLLVRVDPVINDILDAFAQKPDRFIIFIKIRAHQPLIDGPVQ